MTDVNKLLDRIRTHIYLNGDFATEWFEDFDKLRSGRVSKERFHRVFETIRLTLTIPEINMLIDRYSDQGMVNYRRFLDEVQDVFSNKDLEKDPHGVTMDSHNFVLTTQGKKLSTIDERIVPLLRKLAYQVKTRAIHIVESFIDFDPHKNGRITQSQFLRALPFRDLSQAETALLIERYSDPVLKDVNYKRLGNDLDQIINETTETLAKDHLVAPTYLLPHQLRSLKFNQRELPSDHVLIRFAKVVREQRIRLTDFFHSHDPLNKGYITRPKFQGTLTLFGFNFSQEEMDAISDTYAYSADSVDYVKWREFCAFMDELVSQPQAVSVKTRAVSSEPSGALESVLNYIRQAVQRSRINVLPTLQNFDRQKRGFITASQLHRALATLKINLSNEQFKLISDYFGCEEGVDYFTFVERIDPSFTQSRRSFQPIGTTKESIEDVFGHTPAGDLFITTETADDWIYKSKRGLIKKLDEKNDIQSLMYGMKQWSIINSVNIGDFIKDFDRHNCGEVPISQFRSGLSMSSYKLTENEFDTLAAYYASKNRANFIRWRDFEKDLLNAIAPLTLEKSPRTQPQKPEIAYNTRSLVEQKTVQVTDRVSTILDLVSRFVRSRRISLLEQFKDKDKLNHKRCSANHFAQIIQLIGVHISKDQIDALCTFYNDPVTNFVDYPRFVTDVDERVGLIFGDNACSSIVVNPLPAYSKEESPYLVSSRSLTGNEDDWSTICSRLQTYVYKRQVRLTDFFQSFDRLSKGKVTQQKFHSVIGQTNLPLTPSQMDVVALRFTPPGEPDMFDYKSFCAEVNAIFGPTQIVKDPTGQFDKFVKANPDPSATLQTLQAQDDLKIKRILSRMKTDVVSKRLNIVEQFMDYDKMPRKNYVTKQQFKQCIARLGLSTNPAEYDVLCKKYRCTDMDDMNYMAFCRDIGGD